MKRLAIVIVAVIIFLLPLLAWAASTVQIPASGWDYLGGEDSPAVWSRLGQRVVINDGEILAVGYRLCKVGNPSGDITFSIRRADTDVALWSEVWGDAGDLPTANNSTYCRLDISPAVKVDGDVRVCVQYYGGNETDYVQAGYYSGDKITGQWYTNYVNYATDVGGWHDIGEAEEAAYYMSYTSEGTGPADGGNGIVNDINYWWIVAAFGGIVATVLIGAAITRRLDRS